jgi:hypothetical protein
VRHDRAWIVAVLATVILATLAIGWANDYASCIRAQVVRGGLDRLASSLQQQAVRAHARSMIDVGHARALDLKAETQDRQAATRVRVPRLNCVAVLPPI